MSQERLQKILARAGVASRRGAEELIAEGRVTVDGRRVTELGAKADARRQRVELDGRRLEAEPLLYVLFHKPRQVMCTLKDPEGRPTVLDFVKKAGARVAPVGRLDYHTSGVLLLTNDGDFSAALAHPKHKVEKVYVAKVNAPFGPEQVELWSRSIDIEGKPTLPAEVKRLREEDGKVWLEIKLHEGKNRQIHRIAEAAGSQVLRLARLSFAGITHEGLRPGQWRYLSKDELMHLKKTYGVPRKIWLAPPLPEERVVRRVRTSDELRGQRAAVEEHPFRQRQKRPVAARPTRRKGKPLGMVAGEQGAERAGGKGRGARKVSKRPVREEGEASFGAPRSGAQGGFKPQARSKPQPGFKPQAGAKAQGGFKAGRFKAQAATAEGGVATGAAAAGGKRGFAKKSGGRGARRRGED